jgi:hypothetical protein
MPHAIIIHGENLKENFAVSLEIVGRWHEHAKNGGTNQNERFAPPPLAKAGQCLTVIRSSFFVGLS